MLTKSTTLKVSTPNSACPAPPRLLLLGAVVLFVDMVVGAVEVLGPVGAEVAREGALVAREGAAVLEF